MKVIAYKNADGSLAIVIPAQGARLARSLTLPDGAKMRKDSPAPVDTFLRRWPVAGAIVEWAETEDAFVARVATKDVPVGVSAAVVDSADIPADRYFRNAWSIAAGKVAVDMDKAREVHRDKIRQMRSLKFGPLDAAWMKAMGTRDTAMAQDIETQRSLLRDAPLYPAINDAKTPEELKAAIPECLA